MMRTSRLLLVLAALGAAGCLPQASLHPFVEPEAAVEAPEVVGRWGDPETSVRFVREAEGVPPVYLLSEVGPKADTTRFRVRFARIAGRLFADLTVDPRSLPGGSPDPWILWPVHSVFRVDAAEDSLRLAYLDDDWVKLALAGRRVRARHEVTDAGLLLTEDTAGLQRLLRRIANDAAAFDTTAKFLPRLPD